jgi:biofilm PGA synthesis N-glycosyltransferase PgaC
VNPRLRIAVVVPFLDEEDLLPTLLASIARQQRPPDVLLLVDDGSSDGSTAVAARFARAHPYARLLRRPRRPAERDRMARAHEWRAFAWGLRRLGDAWDVVAKLDADLWLAPDLLAEVERRFVAEPDLGIVGAFLHERLPDGRMHLQRCPPTHVEGPNRFYRRECLEDVSPVPAILGWDTIDEVRARMHGWRTRSIHTREGRVVHLRRVGSHDGVLRGYRRAGWAAYAYGAHPLYVLASAAVRLRDRPLLACGVSYLAGYAAAAVRREPRAEPAARAWLRREQRARVAALLGGGHP